MTYFVTPTCVIFATLSNSFRTATVRDKFSVPMLRICYNKRGRRHEIFGHQALYRGRWPQDERYSRRCILEWHEGNRQRSKPYLVGLITAVDSERQQGNLSSAIRLFVLDFYRNQLADVKDRRDDAEGHLKAGAVMQSA